MIIALVVVNSVLALGIVGALLYVVLRLAAYLNPGAYRRVANTDRVPVVKGAKKTLDFINEGSEDNDGGPRISGKNVVRELLKT